jgi:sensor histidine kinase YesM
MTTLAALKMRYDAFAQRLLASLSEVERRDVQAFDDWFYRGAGWRWLAGIVATTTLAAWVASQLPWNMTFVEAAVVFNTLVLSLLWTGLSAWFGYRRFHGQLFRFVLVAVAIVFLGAFVAGTVVDIIHGREPLSWLFNSATLRHIVTGALVFAFLYVLLFALITKLRNREYAALTARLEAEARQSELSRQLAESKLKLLQLQIEPHFLFNTLGSAQQLAERSAPQAAKLIADLIRFLRASTPTLRDDTTTLAQDAMLVAAYLGIMKARLASRLEYGIDLPAELAGCKLPPGLLITLVENAIKHGIEPSPSGGRVTMRAAVERDADGDWLTVTVADTGAGPGSVSGQGIGLANIRERLALLYRGRARLAIARNAPHGFVARLEFPLDAVVSSSDAALQSAEP